MERDDMRPRSTILYEIRWGKRCHGRIYRDTFDEAREAYNARLGDPTYPELRIVAINETGKEITLRATGRNNPPNHW